MRVLLSLDRALATPVKPVHPLNSRTRGVEISKRRFIWSSGLRVILRRTARVEGFNHQGGAAYLREPETDVLHGPHLGPLILVHGA